MLKTYRMLLKGRCVVLSMVNKIGKLQFCMREQLLDTYLHYLQVINDLKKCGYKKDNCDVNDALGYKKKAFVVTLDPLALVAKKTNVSKQKEKVVVSSDSEGSEFVKSNDKKEDKKDDEKKRDMSKVKCYNCKKEGHFAKDCKKANMLLAKKDSDEQVLLAEDQAWMESSKGSSSSADEKISEVSYYLFESKSESEFKTSEYYDNSTNFGLFVNNDDDQEIFHDATKFASENFIENHIDSQKDYDKSDVDPNASEEKDHLVDKFIRKFNKNIVKCQKHVEKANQQRKDFENQNKDLQNTYDVLKNQVNTFEEKNNEFNEQIKVLNEKNDDLLDQTKVLKDQLQFKHVVIDTNVEFKSLKSKGFESSETAISESKNQSENDCQVIEKECDKVENSKVITPGMFKLSVSQSVSPISMSKTSCESNNVENLDTFSSIRRPKNSGVIWKKKWSSNTSIVDLMNDLLDDNNFFIFDDVNVRISPVSKMPFRKRPGESMHVRSKSTMIKSLPKTVHKWLPKLQPLAEPVAKWFPKVKRQIDKISKTPNSP
nr:hypothetical protein [Tanacetum cinerariifolium]